MEARSLGSLNYLAANPPQYPINPAEQKHEPLTLYISRVPGTRDVIFSPFKPGAKNVTAQDVASSLYYVHYELSTNSSAIDLQPPRPFHEDATSRSGSDDHSDKSTSIPRKPLPQHAKPISAHPNDGAPTDVPPPPPPHGKVNAQPPFFNPDFDSQLPLYETLGQPTSRARAGSGPMLEEVPPKVFPDIIGRKPLPSRPRQTSTASLAAEIPNLGEVQFASTNAELLSASDENRRQLPPLLIEQSQPGDSMIKPGGDNSHRLRIRTPSPNEASSSSPGKRYSLPKQQSGPQSFNVSLIRRDPTTGHQWNVGKISSRHEASLQVSSTASYPAIDVQIENTGYNKFRGTNVNRVNAADAEAALKSLTGQDNGKKSLSREDISQILGDTSATTPPGLFTRRVEMAYYKSWTANLKENLKEKIQQIDKQGWKASGKNLIKNRRLSVDMHSDPSHSAAPFLSDLPGMKPRGYTFLSPWSGQCEFVTSSSGRSLRCIHTIPDNGSFNPLVEQTNGHDDDDGSPPRSPSPVISELRFNLPRSDKLFHQTDAVGPHSNAQRVKGHFSKLLGQDQISSNSDDDYEDDAPEPPVSPFDINLGAEKAGGGKGGNRAKLGKLIIYGDGLKMLDLVVAANVGVWWGAWERSQ